MVGYKAQHNKKVLSSYTSEPITNNPNQAIQGPFPNNRAQLLNYSLAATILLSPLKIQSKGPTVIDLSLGSPPKSIDASKADLSNLEKIFKKLSTPLTQEDN